MRLALMLSLLLCAPVRADITIVQVVRMRVGENAPPAQTLTVYHKGQKTRYDVNDALTVIIDIEAKTRTILDRKSKTFEAGVYDPKPDSPPPGKIKITPTQRRTTIAGHPARLYKFETDALGVLVKADIWGAEDIARVELPSLSGGGFDAAAQNRGISGQPLRVRLVSQQKGGLQALLTTEVTAISTREIPDAVFTVPAGFTEKK